MAQLGDSTPSRRVPDLTVVEMRELRRRLQKAKDQVERLREALGQIANPEAGTHTHEDVPMARHYERLAQDALDGEVES